MDKIIIMVEVILLLFQSIQCIIKLELILGVCLMSKGVHQLDLMI